MSDPLKSDVGIVVPVAFYGEFPPERHDDLRLAVVIEEFAGIPDAVPVVVVQDAQFVFASCR